MNNLRRFLKVLTAFIFILEISLSPVLSQETQSTQGKILRIPSSIGKIQKNSSLKSTSEPIAILIEDIHANPETQKNLYKILQHLERWFNSPLQILVEGSSHPVDLDPIRSFPHPQAVHSVSKKYLSKARLSGEEFFAIFSKHSPLIQGAENEENYQQNLKTFRDYKRIEKNFLIHFGRLERALWNQAEQKMNPEIADILRARKAFQEEKIRLPQYIQILIQSLRKQNIPLAKQINIFNTTRGIEESPDFEKLPGRIDALAKRISQIAKKKDLELLLKTSLQVRLFNSGFSKYLKMLQEMSQKYGASEKEGKDLETLLQYHRLMEHIQIKTLFKEIEILIQKLAQKKCQNEDEKVLVQHLLRLDVIKNILSLKATPDFYSKILRSPQNYFPNSWANSLNLLPADSLKTLEEGLTQALKFYQIASIRHGDLAQSVIQNIKKTKMNTVLILGGFHTRAVLNQIKKSGIHTVIISPYISKNINTALYEKMMLGKPAPIGLAFSQEFSLRQPPITDRPEDFLTFQLDIIEKAVSSFSSLQKIQSFLEQAVHSAQSRDTLSPELLDKLRVFTGPHESVILQGEKTALIITPQETQSTFDSDLGLSRGSRLLQQKQSGPWILNVIKLDKGMKETLSAYETISQIPVVFEETPQDPRLTSFIRSLRILGDWIQQAPDQKFSIHVQFEQTSATGKKIYRVIVLNTRGEPIRQFAVKIYDPETFNKNKEELIKNWERWHALAKIDPRGQFIAGGLGYSETEGIFAQEWINTPSSLPRIQDVSYEEQRVFLRHLIQNALHLYIASSGEMIPGDLQAPNFVDGRFIDEEEVLSKPHPFDILSLLSLLPFSMGGQPDQQQIAAETDDLLQTILNAFNLENREEEGLEFLSKAYAQMITLESHQTFLSEFTFAHFLFLSVLEYEKPHDGAPALTLQEIEKKLARVISPKLDTDYQRELIERRPLKAGQKALHLGLNPFPTLAMAEALIGLDVYGIDIQNFTLSSAQKSIQRQMKSPLPKGCSIPRVFQYSAEDLDETHGFSGSTFDHIDMKALFGGSFRGNAQKIIQNVIHLLKEGGTVLITDNFISQGSRNPTEIDLLKQVSEKSLQWDLEWQVEPLKTRDHYTNRIYLATLKKKTHKSSWIELQRMMNTLWLILERYSNVHRGLGQHSQVSTYLFDRARFWIGEKLGINRNEQEVILGTSPEYALTALAHNLRLEPQDRVISDSEKPWNFLKQSGFTIKRGGQLDLAGLERTLQDQNIKIVSIQDPTRLGITPSNVQRLSEVVHRYGARLVIDGSQWPVDEIHVQKQGMDFLIFEGERIAPFAPTVVIARLDLLKTKRDEAPYETGGGTKEIIRTGAVIWGSAPDKFEVGSPNIPGTILFGSLIKNGGSLPFSSTTGRPHESRPESIEQMRDLLIGLELPVPVRDGKKPYINFDNAASTPTFIPIMKAVEDFIQAEPDTQSALLHEALAVIEDYFGAPNDQYEHFSFRNTSEAINYLAHHLLLSDNAVVVNSLVEHNSNELPWRGKNLIHLPIDENGFMDLKKLEHLLFEYNVHQGHPGQKIELIAISGASNVLGTVNDLERISELAHRYGSKLMVDAAQLAAHREVNMDELNIDFLVYSGHKIYAPFGHGGLLARRGSLESSNPISPPSPEGMVALAAMLTILKNLGLENVARHEEELLKFALKNFQELKVVPGVKVKIHGIQDPDSPLIKNKTGVISFNLQIPEAFVPDALKGQPYLPYNLVAAVLAEEGGIGVRSGCFCADLLLQRLLGLTDEDTARMGEELMKGDRSGLPGTTRMSFGIYNTEKEIDRFFEILTKLVQGKYDLTRYQLDKATGEYYTTEHLEAMKQFLDDTESRIFGPAPAQKRAIPVDQQPLYDFIEKLRAQRDRMLPQGSEYLDNALESLDRAGTTVGFLTFYQVYLQTKETFSSLPYQFALWILKNYSPSAGRRHVIFIQRGANSLGMIVKALARELRWTHLEFHDLYINDRITGFHHSDIGKIPLEKGKLNGNNTPEEIFEYVSQEHILDGSPILLIDTGIIGSYPWFLRALLQDRNLWEKAGLHFKNIPVETRLFYFDPPGRVDKQKIREAHRDQIQGLNDIPDIPGARTAAWYDIAHYLDKAVRHPFKRPLRLERIESSGGSKIEPALFPNNALTQLTAVVQAIAVEDLIHEKAIQNDSSLESLRNLSHPWEHEISDEQTVLLSDLAVKGVFTQGLPKGLKIAVLEHTAHDGDAYAGNLVSLLAGENDIQRFTLDGSLTLNLQIFLNQFRPDMILVPQDRKDLSKIIQYHVNRTEKPVTALSYVSVERAPFQNLFVPFSSSIAQVVINAIQAHQSQVTRTAYDQIFDYSTQVAAQKINLTFRTAEEASHAHPFRVGFIKDGKLSIPSRTRRFHLGQDKEANALTIDARIPLLVVSPHSDDLEIAAGGFVRSVLERGSDTAPAKVLNWVIGTGDEWGVQFDADHPASRLPETEQVALKKQIRKNEAFKAASIMSDGTSGKIDVSVFGLRSASEFPQGDRAVLPLNDPQVEEDLKTVYEKLKTLYKENKEQILAAGNFTVVLPHPQDNHPHHRMATLLMLEALKKLSQDRGIEVQLLFYSSPWAGRFNTYFVSKDNRALAESVTSGLQQKMAIAELVKKSLGIILGELFAGFGQRPLTPKELGGTFAERFIRKTFTPDLASASGTPGAQEAPRHLLSPAVTEVFESAA